MKKSRFYNTTLCFSILILGLFTSCAGNKKNTGRQNLKSIPENFYGQYSGLIGNKQINATVYAENGNLSGYYYDLQGKKRIPLFSETNNTQRGDQILLEGELDFDADFNPLPRNEWQFQISQDSLTGEWISKTEGEKYPVALRRISPDGSVVFSYDFWQKNIPLFVNEPDSPFYRVQLFIPEVKNHPDHSDFLNRKIISSMGFDTIKTLSSNIGSFFQKLQKEYRNAYAGMDTSQLFASVNWETWRSVYITYNANDYVVLDENFYDYSGGAHGLSGDSYTVLDLRKEHVVRLNQVVQADSLILQNLIEKYFRIKYDLNPSDSLKKLLFEDYLSPTKHFYFDETGVHFVYSVYEVAPYVVGQINVSVPFEELNPYLTEPFRKRLGLNF